MTDRQAKRWERRRAFGRARYCAFAGLWFFLAFIGCNVVASLLFDGLVKAAPLVISAAIIAPIFAALTYFEWGFREFQYSSFLKARACSENVARA